MKNIQKICLIGFALILTNCAGAGNSKTGTGMIISITDAVHENNNVKNTKSGKACMYNILGIISTGDISVNEAKKDANIQNVASIERSVVGLNYPIPFAKACTKVKGN